MNEPTIEIPIHEGQCGLCVHFGEHHKQHESELHQIRQAHRAKPDLLEECGYEPNRKLHLMVAPMSGCDAFVPAPM